MFYPSLPTRTVGSSFEGKAREEEGRVPFEQLFDLDFGRRRRGWLVETRTGSFEQEEEGWETWPTC